VTTVATASHSPQPSTTTTPGTDRTGGREEVRARRRVLVLSTSGFTLMFAVWLMFGVLGIPIRKEFGLSDVQLSWLSAVAILNGALWRLPAGVLADRYGGRRVFVAMLFFTAIPAYLVSQVTSFGVLLFYAFLAGFAGNAFSVGIAWCSAWYPRHQQGFALGVFGAGNVGASVTKFIAPALIAAVPAAGYVGGVVPGGWRFVPFLYAVLLVVMGALDVGARAAPGPASPAVAPIREMLRPLRSIRVVAASASTTSSSSARTSPRPPWLPKYYVDNYDVRSTRRAPLGDCSSSPRPAAPRRAVTSPTGSAPGGCMYGTFGTMLVSTLLLSMPYGHIVLYVPERYEADGTREVMEYQLGIVPFTALVFIVGIAMGVGKAGCLQAHPEYFPNDVGAGRWPRRHPRRRSAASSSRRCSRTRRRGPACRSRPSSSSSC
jgi:NNP family nitrate/nitrite transporter-like MFS transporter